MTRNGLKVFRFVQLFEPHIVRFTNYGSCLDTWGAGEYVYSSYYATNSGNGEYAIFSGTSMASPHVAGWVAAVLTDEPDASVSDVLDLLDKSAWTRTVNSCDSSSQTCKFVFWKAGCTNEDPAKRLFQHRH